MSAEDLTYGLHTCVANVDPLSHLLALIREFFIGMNYSDLI